MNTQMDATGSDRMYERSSEHVVVQMVCNRCPAASQIAFASDAVASGSQQGRAGRIQVSAHCPNCHQDWSASLQPRLVHAHSNVLASIRSQGCSPLDLLPSLMAAQCSNCSAAASLRCDVGPGTETLFSARCNSSHSTFAYCNFLYYSCITILCYFCTPSHTTASHSISKALMPCQVLSEGVLGSIGERMGV